MIDNLKIYSILNNITLQKVNIEKLHSEILASGFVEEFSGLSIEEDDLIIFGESIIDEIQLDNLILIHEEESLDDLKNKKYIEIDNRTSELINEGFIFDGHRFSMSLTAQINWSNFPNLPEQLFPLNVVDIEEGVYVLFYANKFNFYFAALNYKNQFLQSGGVLKTEIKACETPAEVDLIIDNR
jgi:hypothetical protein